MKSFGLMLLLSLAEDFVTMTAPSAMATSSRLFLPELEMHCC
jgi:hypothetical protein